MNWVKTMVKFLLFVCLLAASLAVSAQEAAVEQTEQLKTLEHLAEELKLWREQQAQAFQIQDQHLRVLEADIRRLGEVLKNAGPGVAKAKAEEKRVPSEPLPPSPPDVHKPLTVCHQGCDFQNLQQAVNAAPAGGEVSVAAEINGTCAVINKPLHLVGLRAENGQRAHLAGGVCMGKAPLVTAAANILVEGFEISNVAVGGGNGACVRMDPGTRDLVVRNVYCHDSQEGLLGTSAGRLLIENSVFENNGYGNGQAHGLYLNQGEYAEIRNSLILSTANAGHSVKSGFQHLLIEDSVIAGLNGHNSRALDAFAGGDVVLRRNIIQQGPNADNSDIIGLALESARLLPVGHSLLMESNWVVFDDPGRGQTRLFRGQKLGPVTVRNNVLVGVAQLGMDGVEVADNHWFASRQLAGLPEYDGTVRSLPSRDKMPSTRHD